MIGLERVAHSEQRSEAGAGEQVNNWHNERTSSFYCPVTLLLIAVGGALGSVARYLVSTWVLRLTNPYFPYGTFVVNVLGCVIFGLIVGLAQQRLPLSAELRAFFLVGVLGGFTTFSTFAFDSMSLLRDGQSGLALVNMAGQVVLGVAALYVGFRLGS